MSFQSPTTQHNTTQHNTHIPLLLARTRSIHATRRHHRLTTRWRGQTQQRPRFHGLCQESGCRRGRSHGDGGGRVMNLDRSIPARRHQMRRSIGCWKVRKRRNAIGKDRQGLGLRRRLRCHDCKTVLWHDDRGKNQQTDTTIVV